MHLWYAVTAGCHPHENLACDGITNAEEMNPIELKLNKDLRGAFVIEDGENKLAEMVVAVSAGNLIAYHTEVSDSLRGQGIAGKLLENMVDYARKNNLKVVPLCPYVHAQFKRHPEKYNDIWNKKWHG